jgi:hypothetical protein
MLEMSKKQEDPKEKKAKPKEEFSCMEMMAKMMGQSEEELSCETIAAKFMEEDEIPGELSEMMSQTSGCCGPQPEESEEA